MNIMKMMKEMSKVQENMKAAQEKLEEIEVQGQAGAGMVSVTMNGKMKLVKVSISPDAMAENDASLIEDLVLAATEDAHIKAKAAAAEEMKGVTGGMPLPEGMNPFA